jgi:hypothetical protein
MKIEIKINSDTVLALNSLLHGVYGQELGGSTMQKVHRSIAYELSEKFNTKAKNIIKNANLFDTKKTHNFKLKFYEAWTLHAFLEDTLNTQANEYRKTLLRKLKDNLNQKLV